MKNDVDVRNANRQHSKIFFHGELTYRLRKMPRLMLTWMNSAPMSPAIVPIIIAAGKSRIVFISEVLTEPNLSEPESDNDKGVAVLRD